jgi:hypothetical protein
LPRRRDQRGRRRDARATQVLRRFRVTSRRTPLVPVVDGGNKSTLNLATRVKAFASQATAPAVFQALSERMMGLEPTTFCMARASDCSRSRPFAQTACLHSLPPEGANASEPERTPTLPFLPRVYRRAGRVGDHLITTVCRGFSPVAPALSTPRILQPFTLKDSPSGMSSSSTAGGRAIFDDRAFSRTCRGFVLPASVEVTPVWCGAKAIASCGTDARCRSATWRIASTRASTLSPFRPRRGQGPR